MVVSLRATRELAERIDGWLTAEEGELLYELARNCTGSGVIVEIGSWKGRSTTWLARGARAGNDVPVYAIDPHHGSVEHAQDGNNASTLPEFVRNMELAGVRDIVHPIVATSLEAVVEFSEPVELLFYDGAHGYPEVKADFEAWFPKVISGGVMVLNNTTAYPGPTRVAAQDMYRSRNFRHVQFLRAMTYGEKVERNSTTERLRNHYGLLLRQSYRRASEAHFPGPIRSVGRQVARLVQ